MSLVAMLEIFVGVITGLILLAFGYFAVFRTKKVIDYYLNSAKKNYSKALKMNFLGKYFQALTKFQYENRLRKSGNGMANLNFKLVGSGSILMGLLYLILMLHLIFKWKFGFITN
jgi:hypothetical protein